MGSGLSTLIDWITGRDRTSTRAVLMGDPAFDDDLIQVYDLQNYARQARGLKPLELNQALINAASAQAVWCSRVGQMTHLGPGRSRVMSRVVECGYHAFNVGENVAMGHSSGESVFEGWMQSAGHRKNVLTPAFEHVGLGAAKARDGRIYWCVVFGSEGFTNG